VTTISTLTTTWSLPSTASNAYEGGDALIAFNAHVVQSAHNTLACTTTPTVGQQCVPGTGFQWNS
jgi:hypothetical protein